MLEDPRSAGAVGLFGGYVNVRAGFGGKPGAAPAPPPPGLHSMR